jgi:hypothetical protein
MGFGGGRSSLVPNKEGRMREAEVTRGNGKCQGREGLASSKGHGAKRRGKEGRDEEVVLDVWNP